MTTLRRRLFVATGAAVLVAVGVSLLIGAVIVRHAVRQSIVTNLGRQADAVAARVELLAPRRPPALRRGKSASGARLSFLPLASAERMLPAGAARALAQGQGAEGQATIGGRGVLYAARAAGSNAIVLSRPDRLGGRDWRPFLDAFLIAGLVGAAIAAVVSALLARAIGGPVARVARASRELAAGGSPQPLPVEGPEELASLAASFNEMQTQLASARERERSFLLSVSHELKTPLTAIRGYVEALADGAVPAAESGATIGREAARLERLVRDLLDLARLDQRAFAVRREPLDLREAAGEVVARHAHLAEELGVALTAGDDGPAPASADYDRVLQVASNLVENALRATPAGGSVTVSAAPGELAVSDTGPGLAPEDVEHAFERFYLHRRLGGERALGSGLGLAIVENLAQAMGGSVSVSSAPGAGARFVVRLPPRS